ncbi:MAG TPA: GGDEF domain-containing protein [Thiohalobacter sp.]|nr:GGDEF domain-containing protein [Thiohalobacter sp.]
MHNRNSTSPGTAQAQNVDRNRQAFIIALFSTVGSAYLFMFGFSALTRGDRVLGGLLVCSALAGISNYLLFRQLHNYRSAAGVVIAIMTITCLYLLVTGGVNGTGPLWSYIAIPLILFMYGPRLGGGLLGAYFLVMVALLLIPDNPLRLTTYETDFISRFLASFLAVSIMSYVHEYSRFKANLAMQSLRQAMEREARTDTLTGLPNRRAMYEQLQQELARARRMHHPWCLLLCDLDDFKQINDSHGHQVGDAVLKETGGILRHCLRASDFSARWGGEEFLVLLPETDLHEAEAVAEKIRDRISHIRIDGIDRRFTISIGVYQADSRGGLDDQLRQADRRLYAAKRSGKNRVVSTEPA